MIWLSGQPSLAIAPHKSAVADQDRMDQQSTDFSDLLFEMRNGIGRATFNRPQARNAFTFELYERLAQICDQADKDRSIKVLVLQRAGDKPFASGTDINQFGACKTLDHPRDYQPR